MNFRNGSRGVTMARVWRENTRDIDWILDDLGGRAVLSSGVNTNGVYAKPQMAVTRSLFGKNDGVQGHVVIQSFKVGELTSELAHGIGLLADFIAPEHEIMVYTTNSNELIENHIVVNSVHMESGKKYHSSRADYHAIQYRSDEICVRYGLSTIGDSNKIKKRSDVSDIELSKKIEEQKLTLEFLYGDVLSDLEDADCRIRYEAKIGVLIELGFMTVEDRLALEERAGQFH